MRFVLFPFFLAVIALNVVFPAGVPGAPTADNAAIPALVVGEHHHNKSAIQVPSPPEAGVALSPTEVVAGLDDTGDGEVRELLLVLEETNAIRPHPGRSSPRRAFFRVFSCFSKALGSVAHIVASDALQDAWFRLFLFLFLFRYARLTTHIIAYMTLKAVPIPVKPTYAARDVTVIIPTVEPHGPDFDECLRRVCANRPAKVLVVTVGGERVATATKSCAAFGTMVAVLSCAIASKREQTMRAAREVTTPLIAQCDDTVFWPPTFLVHAIAPFEDPHVGIVGVVKRVRRCAGAFGWADFWNLCGVMRLERTNFDLAATYAVDGGLSCISGRSCLVRAAIFLDPAFVAAFLNEYIFWGMLGPLNAGDDKFVTRWVIKQGWRICHQACAEARIETKLGVKGGATRYLAQCLRWARTSARDNPKMLFKDRRVWVAHPWTAYAVLLNSIINYAAVYDPLLVYALRMALRNDAVAILFGFTASPLVWLAVWILAGKFVRPAGHYWRNPRDLLYAPFVIAFGYYHSYIKLKALVTCWDISWSTRAGVDVPKAVKKD